MVRVLQQIIAQTSISSMIKELSSGITFSSSPLFVCCFFVSFHPCCSFQVFPFVYFCIFVVVVFLYISIFLFCIFVSIHPCRRIEQAINYSSVAATSRQLFSVPLAMVKLLDKGIKTTDLTNYNLEPIYDQTQFS